MGDGVPVGVADGAAAANPGGGDGPGVPDMDAYEVDLFAYDGLLDAAQEVQP